MTTTLEHPGRASTPMVRSLWSGSVTMILATITHTYDLGPVGLVIGAVVIAALVATSRRYTRTGSRPAFVAYLLLILWVVVGFGVVGGFWNHAVKALVVAVTGTLPASSAPFCMTPALGDTLYEGVGILTFAASAVAAWFGYRLVRASLGRGQDHLAHAPRAGAVP